MREFHTLDAVNVDDETGIIYITAQEESQVQPRIFMRREGGYVAISVNYGPIEIAMRLRYAELARVLARLRPVEGLQTTRQVGTGQAHLALGLQKDGALVIRPTIIADATGHTSFNLILADNVRATFYEWLPVTSKDQDQT